MYAQLRGLTGLAVGMGLSLNVSGDAAALSRSPDSRLVLVVTATIPDQTLINDDNFSHHFAWAELPNWFVRTDAIVDPSSIKGAHSTRTLRPSDVPIDDDFDAISPANFQPTTIEVFDSDPMFQLVKKGCRIELIWHCPSRTENERTMCLASNLRVLNTSHYADRYNGEGGIKPFPERLFVSLAGTFQQHCRFALAYKKCGQLRLEFAHRPQRIGVGEASAR